MKGNIITKSQLQNFICEYDKEFMERMMERRKTSGEESVLALETYYTGGLNVLNKLWKSLIEE